MAPTNYGNGYKFAATMKRRSHTEIVMVQRLRKNGTWGKPLASQVYGKETPEQVVERLTKNNPTSIFRLAEAE